MNIGYNNKTEDHFGQIASLSGLLQSPCRRGDLPATKCNHRTFGRLSIIIVCIFIFFIHENVKMGEGEAKKPLLKDNHKLKCELSATRFLPGGLSKLFVLS